ncbi:MAG: polysaccharide biosynthesis C-terminal domain-containing protein, partial [Candidatus Thorarchaeota archaeon]
YGLTLLILLSLSGIFISINYIGNAIMYIRHKIKFVILVNFINLVVILTLSYYFVNLGLYGIGISWIIGNAIVSLMYLFLFAQKRLIQS